jgi:hypothetical protein
VVRQKLFTPRSKAEHVCNDVCLENVEIEVKHRLVFPKPSLFPAEPVDSVEFWLYNTTEDTSLVQETPPSLLLWQNCKLDWRRPAI